MNKLVVYGSHFCPGCVELKKELEERAIPFEYYDISLDFAALKSFLKIRDTYPIYDPVKEGGKIGIPTIILDGEPMLEADEEKILEFVNRG
jgi:glutaredoxin-related protein